MRLTRTDLMALTILATTMLSIVWAMHEAGGGDGMNPLSIFRALTALLSHPPHDVDCAGNRQLVLPQGWRPRKPVQDRRPHHDVKRTLQACMDAMQESSHD